MRILATLLVTFFALGTIGCGASSQQTKATVASEPAPAKKLMKKKKKSNRMEMVIEDE